MKCYFEARSVQTAKRGEGILLYPLTQKLMLGRQRPGLVHPRARLVRMESFWIQTVTGRLTRTSLDRDRTSPVKAELGSWLTQTSLDKGQTSLDNPGWIKLDDPDLSKWVRIGRG
jgi:hypothetical protein